MEESKKLEWLLECLIHVIGRAAVKAEDVCQIVGRDKQMRAFNLCDGTMTLTEIARKTGLDQGNLSRAVDRWIKNGILFRYDEGNEVRPLHIFPIPKNLKVKPKVSKGQAR
jgi:hypothetical protein